MKKLRLLVILMVLSLIASSQQLETELCARIVHTYNSNPDIALEVITLAELNGVSPVILSGLIGVESRFNPKAISVTNDWGLMQINKPIWSGNLKLTDQDLLDPRKNLEAGIKILTTYGISNYNSRDSEKSRQYINRVAIEAFKLSTSIPSKKAREACRDAIKDN